MHLHSSVLPKLEALSTCQVEERREGVAVALVAAEVEERREVCRAPEIAGKRLRV